MLSLGCGQRDTIRLTQDSGELVTGLEDIVSDCELVDRELARRMAETTIYYRLSVDRNLNSAGETSLDPVGGIVTWTKVFLEHPNTGDKLNQCIEASGRLGRVKLMNICKTLVAKRSHAESFAAGFVASKATARGLPSLSAFFVERPGLIKQMAQCLFPGGPPAQRRLVLSGLGGIGKTQITISFLKLFLSRFGLYPNITQLLIHTPDFAIFSSSMAVLSKVLRVASSPRSNRSVQRTLARLLVRLSRC